MKKAFLLLLLLTIIVVVLYLIGIIGLEYLVIYGLIAVTVGGYLLIFLKENKRNWQKTNN